MTARAVATTRRQNGIYQWFSSQLHKEMTLKVIGHSGARVLFFPSRSGRYFDFENWHMHKYIQHKIEAGLLQIFCLDSLDAESMYCWWAEPQGRIARHLQYESYLLEEVIPFTRAFNANTTLISAGYSFGAFHAMNIALRHPQYFEKVLAMSGRYSLTDELPGFRDLFDGVITEDIYYNNPSHYLPNMPKNEQLEKIRALDITFVVGKEDPFLSNNQHLSQVMWEKGITHQFIEWDGHAHTGYYWRRMIDLYL